MLTDILVLIVAFFAGSIPFSWLIARYRYGVDLRTTGDGNVGAGNLFHVSGIVPVMVAIILDGLKAGVAVLLAYPSDEWVVLAAGAIAIVGHVFPPWLAFNGGRGAAPAIGVAVALFPLPGLVMLAMGLAALVGTRRTVAGIAAAVISLVAIVLITGDDLTRLLFVAIVFIVVGLKDVVDRLIARRAGGTATG